VFEEERKTWREERGKGEKVVLLFQSRRLFRRISIPQLEANLKLVARKF
jgi:hypothetical protein